MSTLWNPNGRGSAILRFVWPADESDRLRRRDWRDIRNHLRAESQCPTSDRPDQVDLEVVPIVNELRALPEASVVGSGAVTNRLLDLWGAAHDLDPRAARPVELLLSALIGRDLVHRDEIDETCEQVLAVLRRARPRSRLIGSS